MARKSNTGQDGNKIDTVQNIKNEDIYSAAKSTMGPTDYADGYPAQPGNLRQGIWIGKQLPKAGSKED
jgi:hypothetical protein